MASLLRRSCSLAPARRAFSTSTPRLATLQWDRNNSEALADTIPEYPHGPPTIYKQQRHGLYGGQRIRFGNNVSVKGKNKSRRSWRPNIQNKRLFSKALNRHVQVRVNTRVLRTIDKLGGLDEYLLGEKETRIRELGESGWWLRWAIMQTPTVQERFAAQREALGLPAKTEELRIEEEDAEAVLAASTPDAEIAELTLEEDADVDLEAEPLVSSVLAEDDAFQVEQSRDLPPLRFRVGRNKHIELTENGWRSVKPKVDEVAVKNKIRLSLEDVKAQLMSSKIANAEKEVLRRVLKDCRPTHEVLAMRPVQPEQRDQSGELVMEQYLKVKKIRDLKKRQTFQRGMDALEESIKAEVNKKIWRMVQEKYERPLRKLEAAKARAKAARQEKASEIAVPVESVPA
ncbi:hypothetical protein Q7P37_003860 [Cladosporium fusiforme]